jgi:hypothetical protein
MTAGVFLVEARDDVADRMIVDAAGRHVEFEDELVRPGHKATEVAPRFQDALTADDVAHRERRAELVVLSGCGTRPGTRTARFMEAFYTATENPDAVPKPLRFAQLRTRDRPSNAVWSSFVVRANELP